MYAARQLHYRAMISRYTRPAMGHLWTDQARYDAWLRVELAVCEAWAERGAIPQDALERIRAKAAFSVERIDELELTLNHDVLSFTTSVGESIGEDSAWFHKGLTSSDVVDTAQCLTLVEAFEGGTRKASFVLGLLLGLGGMAFSIATEIAKYE